VSVTERYVPNSVTVSTVTAMTTTEPPGNSPENNANGARICKLLA